MYYLKSTKDDVHFYLLGKTVFTVGRKNSDFNLLNDDSISRAHAKVSIRNNNVFVEDTRSKYGTFMDSSIQLKAEVPKQLKCDQNIKFGVLENIFTLKRLELDVAISSLVSADQTQLNRYLARLDSKIATEWSDQSTHLVVNDSFKLTAKVLCAITLKQPIVTVQYFKDLVTAVELNKPVSLDYMNYLPTLHETLLSKNIRLEYNAERRTVFRDKIFVFLSEQKLHYMDALATITGGRAIAWKKDLVPRSKLKATKPEYLFVESVQDSASQCYDDFFTEIQFLNSIGRRSIPFQEIALAIMHCSTTEYCNSFLNKTLVISDTEPPTTERILAYDTQHKWDAEHQTNTEHAAPVLIDPSYDSTPCSKRTLAQSPTTALAPNVKRARQQQEPSTSSVIPSKSLQTAFSFNDSEKPSGNKNQPIAAPVRTEPTYDSVPCSKRSLTQSSNTLAANVKRARLQHESLSTSLNRSSSLIPSKPLQTAFSFNDSDEPNENEDIIVNNPFASKRKATKSSELQVTEPATKKRNVDLKSSITDNSDTIPSSTQSRKQLTSSHTESETLRSLSPIQNIHNWMSNAEETNTLPNEEEDDDEYSKYNESFRNCIAIDVIPIIVRRSISINRSDSLNVSNILKNFKKFKKVHQSFVQTDIIITKTYKIPGSTASDEEQVAEQSDDDEFDRIEPPSRVAPPKSRRKFQYVT